MQHFAGSSKLRGCTFFREGGKTCHVSSTCPTMVRPLGQYKASIMLVQVVGKRYEYKALISCFDFSPLLLQAKQINYFPLMFTKLDHSLPFNVIFFFLALLTADKQLLNTSNCYVKHTCIYGTI